VKLLTIWIFFLGSLFAKEHYAKVEPYMTLTLSSNVSGQVLFVDEAKLGSVLGEKAFIDIDDTLDVAELKSIEQKIVLLEETLKLNKTIIENYEMMLERKEKNFERVNALKIKSSVEKDREFYDVVATQNQYISTKKEVENLKIQINDLKLRKTQLHKTLKDKHLSAKGYVLYATLVKTGQYVNPSTPLAELADISKAKLTLYLNPEELEGIEKKSVYIDGKKTDYKVDRLWPIADAQHLSSFKAEIVIDAPKYFSQLLKVELKVE